MPGRFITFEGGEGAGKSTQIERLRSRLAALGHPVALTREPGGSPKAERIRDILLSGRAKDLGPAAEALLFYAARLDHVDQVIRPSLDKGITVLSDRFSDSTRAYQGALGEVDPRILAALERVIVADTRPDLTLVLDVPAPVGLARAGLRRRRAGEGADRFEAEGETFHTALRHAFLDIAAADPDRCAVIDAGGDAASVEEAVWGIVRERLPDLAKPAAAPAHVA
jgi:dTMP kinase